MRKKVCEKKCAKKVVRRRRRKNVRSFILRDMFSVISSIFHGIHRRGTSPPLFPLLNFIKRPVSDWPQMTPYRPAVDPEVGREPDASFDAFWSGSWCAKNQDFLMKFLCMLMKISTLSNSLFQRYFAVYVVKNRFEFCSSTSEFD